jgi:formylglycine-generating enzyme required for sulfatase activity
MSAYAWTETEPRLRVAAVAEAPSVKTADMIRIPGGTFRMGSDKHYPEEAPVHRVTVSDFWIDRTPVTNRLSVRRAGAQSNVHFTRGSNGGSDVRYAY